MTQVIKHPAGNNGHSVLNPEPKPVDPNALLSAFGNALWQSVGTANMVQILALLTELINAYPDKTKKLLDPKRWEKIVERANSKKELNITEAFKLVSTVFKDL